MKKKLLPLLVVLCLVAGLFPALSAPAQAVETPRIEVDGVIYEPMFWGSSADGTITSINALMVVGAAPGVTDISIPKNLSFETESGEAVQTWTGKPVTYLANEAFQGNTTLRSVDLSALTGLGDIVGHKKFAGCTALERVILPPDMKKVHDDCFSGCTSLRQIDLPAGVTEIGVRAFANTGLTSIDLPDGLQKLGSACFQGTNITDLTIPASVTVMGKVTGLGERSLKTITFEATDLSNLEMSIGNIPTEVTVYVQPGAKATMSKNLTAALKNNLVLTVGEAEPNFGLSFDKTSVDLGTIKAHTLFGLPFATITLTNTGDTAVDGLYIDWSRDRAFSLEFPDNPKGMVESLAPGESFRIKVMPQQNLKEGDYDWDLTINSNRGVSATANVKLKVKKGADGLYFQDDNAVLDFGTKNVGDRGTGNKLIDIFNGSDKEITLTAPQSQYYNISFGSGGRIAAGGYLGLSITPKFGTKTAGDFTEVLHFEPGNPAADLTVKYVVNSGAISVSPTNVTFDSENEGYTQPSPKTVTITNTGKTTVSLDNPEISGKGFTITSYPSTYSLDAGKSVTVAVQPKSGLKEGDYSGSLTITGTTGVSASVSLNFTVKNGEYSISASPNSLTFGTIKEKEAQPSAQTVTVTNSGKETVTLKAPTSSNYIIGSLSRSSLSAGQSATFTVRPKADLKKGTYNETLTIGTDKDAKATVSVSFTVKSENAPTFTDVPEDVWYFDAVEYAKKNGLMDGKGNGQFDPNGTTTRGEIVTILYRLEGNPAVSSGESFTDVPAGQWYSNAVLWASQNKIVNGVGNHRFEPGTPITREQMSSILFRYAAYKRYDVSKRADLSRYQDLNKVSAYARDAFAWANSEKLVNGATATTLNPSGRATRAEAAVILYRFCENVAK